MQNYEAFTPELVRRVLTVTEDECKQTRCTIDRVAEALRQGFHPQKVYLGGSFKKGTSLRGSYDVDLVIFLNDFDPRQMENHKAKARSILSRHGVTYKEQPGTPYCMKIDYNTGFVEKPVLHFDLLFTGDPRKRLPGVAERYYMAAEAPENDDMVMEALKRCKGLRELILLSKHWRAQQRFTHWGLTSFYVELACIKVKTASPDSDLQTAFKQVLKLIARGESMNKSTGQVCLPDAALKECQEKVQATLKTIQPEFVFMPPSLIRFAQKNVGSHFRDKRSLEETACQLVRAEIEKRDIEMIRIVKHDDGRFYSMDNRRLAVFRLLQYVGKTRSVKARVVPKDPKEWKFKFDTDTQGLSVVVRRTDYVIGASAETTTYPLERLRSTMAEGNRVEIPAMESDDETELESPPTKRRKVDEFNHASCATYSREPFAHGAFRVVHSGKYTSGDRTGDECVVKMFKTRTVFEDKFFEADIEVVNVAARFITRFNEVMGNSVKKHVYLNRPEIWSQTSDGAGQGQKQLVEPKIPGVYHSFNSNTGYVGAGYEVMQALSHFSYHESNGDELLCDLQGAITADAFILTDPVVLSRQKKYGPTDLGMNGILNFMARHVCTPYCQATWRKAVGATPCLPAVKGTTFAA